MGEKKYLEGDNFSEKEKHKKTLKIKNLNLFLFLGRNPSSFFKKKYKPPPFPPFGLGKANQRNHTNTQMPAELPPFQQIFFPFDLPHSSQRPQHSLSCSYSPS
ncbi:hypothetical protein Peur_032108 [Populus x canadensis]